VTAALEPDAAGTTTQPHPPGRPHRRRAATKTAVAGVTVAGLSLTAIALQVAYPLTPGAARDALTAAIVIVFSLASTAHAWVSRGRRAAGGLLLITAVGGYGVESLGLHAGFPFGTYAYNDTLGPRIGGVPLIVGLAWTMFAWPAAVVAARLTRRYWTRVVVGAWALAAWDVFLDPQMVQAGHWRWSFAGPALPGIHTVPLTNHLGWLLVATLMMCALVPLVGGPRADGWPYALFLWTWLSSTLALGAFWGLAAAAGWGALALGLVGAPLLLSLPSGRILPEWAGPTAHSGNNRPLRAPR